MTLRYQILELLNNCNEYDGKFDKLKSFYDIVCELMNEELIIGIGSEVTFIQFNKTAKAKIDTGAAECSLHATNISTEGDAVSFDSQILSANRLTLPLADIHTIKSADGGENKRPVVMLDVSLKDVVVKQVAFNLNDRTDMEDSILLGNNLLSKVPGLLVRVGSDSADNQQTNSNRVDAEPSQ
jgi:hypothetical protein